MSARKFHDLKAADHLVEEIKDAIDTLGRAAAIASKVGSQEDRQKAQEAAERLIEDHRELKFVLDAMVYLGSKGNARAYRISSDTTDFQSLVENTVVQLKVRSNSSGCHLTTRNSCPLADRLLYGMVWHAPVSPA